MVMMLEVTLSMLISWAKMEHFTRSGTVSSSKSTSLSKEKEKDEDEDHDGATK